MIYMSVGFLRMRYGIGVIRLSVSVHVLSVFHFLLVLNRVHVLHIVSGMVSVACAGTSARKHYAPSHWYGPRVFMT